METTTQHRWVLQVDDKAVTERFFHTDKRCPRLLPEKNLSGGRTLTGSGLDPGPDMWDPKQVHLDLSDRECAILGAEKCSSCDQRDQMAPVNDVLRQWHQEMVDRVPPGPPTDEALDGLRLMLDAAGYKIVTAAEARPA